MKKISVFLTALVFIIVFSNLQPVETQAASKTYLTLRGDKKSLKNKTLAIYVGEKKVNLSYLIGGKRRKVKGYWTSSNRNIVFINQNGTCVAKNNGKVTLKFTYYVGKKKRVLSTKMRAFTKPSEVSLFDKEENEDVVMKPLSAEQFYVNLTPIESAKKINSKIKSNFPVYYELFGDEDCTKPTDLGVVDTKGRVRTKEYGGTMYLRAYAKSPTRSAKAIYSNVSTITIEGLSKEEKAEEEERKRKEAAAEEERKRKEAEEALAKSKTRPARIEIIPQAQIDPTTPIPRPKNQVIFAYAGFKVFDGNGKDITHEPTTDMNAMVGKFKWSEMEPAVTFNQLGQKGKATLALLNIDKVQLIQNKQITTPRQIDYTQGELTLTYKQSGFPDVTATANVTIVPQAAIRQVEVKGIYKRDFTSQNYIPALVGDNVSLKKGDIIGTSGGNISLNSLPGSYYLLLKVTDVYNNNVASAGITAQSLNLLVSGTSGITLDAATGLTGGGAVIQSITPIVIDGVPYLTFPLKNTTVIEGNLSITAQGMQPFNRQISDGSTLMIFYLTGSIIGGKGRAIVGQENILDYSLITTTGQNVKKFEQVLSYLKISNPGNSPLVTLLPNSDIISASKYSRISIRKNSAGDAEIIYTPQANVLDFIPNSPQTSFIQGKEDITILKGWKQNSTQMSLERTIPVMVFKD